MDDGWGGGNKGLGFDLIYFRYGIPGKSLHGNPGSICILLITLMGSSNLKAQRVVMLNPLDSCS